MTDVQEKLETKQKELADALSRIRLAGSFESADLSRRILNLTVEIRALEDSLKTETATGRAGGKS
jgi:hypothetical protein